MFNYYSFLLKILPPEVAHEFFFKYLKLKNNFSNLNFIENHTLKQQIWGLNFNNPIGIAAGFDKNAEVILPLINLGFGFIEVGTVTPLPQKGNTKPRVFRLLEDEAIINNLGFNNIGADKVKIKLSKLKNINPINGIIGVNIGKNRDSQDYISDYSLCLKKLGPLVDYVTINISSPNTKGLRDLQNEAEIKKLFNQLNIIKKQNSNLEKKILLLKIAPDLKDHELNSIAKISMELDINGIIISNTTTERSTSLISNNKDKLGGLSGRPLFNKSTNILKKMYSFTEGKIPLIGVGGVSNGKDCYQKIKSGASLVQLYTSLIYQGPKVVESMQKELVDCIKNDGYKNIKDAIGKEA